MIAALIARLVAAGVPTKLAKPLLYLIGGLLLCGLLWAIWSLWLADHDADVIDAHESKVTIETLEKGRKADQGVVARQQDREAQRGQDRKEFDNATVHLPPAGLTARQRIDACRQLRRQGESQAVLASAGCL